MFTRMSKGINVFHSSRRNTTNYLERTFAKETMLAYFSKIDLGYDPASNEVIVPSWRQDLECDADLAEEVARFFGYDKIPTTLPSGEGYHRKTLPSNSASRQ